MDRLNVGIIGFGRIGAEHAGWLSNASSARAAAVADATPARQQKARQAGLRVAPDVEALLADESIDAILVASPTAMHLDHARRALSAGKHVMVEKPMALDLPSAMALGDQSRASGKVLSVFHNRRWDIDYLTVRELLAGGALGKLINIESRLGQFASCVGPAAREYRPNWRNEASFGGGGLYDWGSHFVDQLWRLLVPAKPVRVFAQLRANVWSSDCDDFARVLIDFDNGVAGLVEINTTTSAPLPRWHLDGTAGSAASPASLTFDTREWAALQWSPARGEAAQFPMADPGLTQVQMWDQFAAAVRGQGQPAVTVDSVLPTMALLDAARESSRSGQAVALPDGLQWT